MHRHEGPCALVELPPRLQRRLLENTDNAETQDRKIQDWTSTSTPFFRCLVLANLSTLTTWEESLAQWSLSLRPHARLILMDRTKPAVVTTRLLCAGFHDIAQYTFKGRIITTATKA